MDRYTRSIGTLVKATRSITKSSLALLLTLGTLGLSPLNASADGDWDQFVIDSLQEQNPTSYKLILRPLSKKSVKDTDLRHCKKVEVLGRYSSWHSWLSFPEYVTEEGHVKALTYMKEAQGKKKVINFGGEENGFAPMNPGDPCQVTSRALSLVDDGKFKGVVSYSD